MKIVFIGGHHNSALVVAQMLAKRGHSIFWFGHKHTMRGEKSLSAEYLEITKQNWPFFEIKTGKFYRTYNPIQYLKIIFGFCQSLYLLITIRPKVIVSFGGYLSVPVVLAGFLLRIPSMTHEQTTLAGLANLAMAPFVKKVFLTWSSSQKFFPKDKTILVGLPLQENILSAVKKEIFSNKRKTIFIIGGKQGSHLLNSCTEEILDELLKHYNVIQQTGRIEKTNDWSKAKKRYELLPADLQKNYLVKPYFFTDEMINLLVATDLVVSRAGAHIVYELLALGKPAILVPLSWAYKNEQFNNALALVRAGSSVVLSEQEINGKVLLKKIEECFVDIRMLTKSAQKAKALIKSDAAEKMVFFIEKEL